MPDRVEASAVFTRSGRFVVVGCYDHRVYFIDSLTGDVAVSFETGDQVKSAAAVHEDSGDVFVGSRDGSVYHFREFNKGSASGKSSERFFDNGSAVGSASAPGIGSVNISVCDDEVDAGNRIELMSKKDLHSGGIVASLCVSGDRLFVSTLGGVFFCLHLSVEGNDPREKKENETLFLSVLWHSDFGSPLFASPYVFRDRVFVGCVDGKMAAFSTHCDTGDNFDDCHLFKVKSDSRSRSMLATPLWTFQAGGPIFSSPNIIEPNWEEAKDEDGGDKSNFLVFGCHDGNLYAVDGQSGKIIWVKSFDKVQGESARTGSPSAIYSSPAVWRRRYSNNAVSGSVNSPVICWVMCALADGRLYLIDSKEGSCKSVLNSNAEIFSSPVVLPGVRDILLGSRNDFLLCYNLLS